MASRGSKLSRMVAWFQSGEYEEAAYVLGRATDIMRKRMAAQGETTEAPKTKRARRTKAQVAAEKSEHATNSGQAAQSHAEHTQSTLG